MEERAIAADKRIAELTAALTATMMDGSVIKDLKTKIVRAEKERDDAKAPDIQNRAERYGSTSQKIRKSNKTDKPEDDDDHRDAGWEKSEMGGKNSVKSLSENQGQENKEDSWLHDHYENERPYRQGWGGKIKIVYQPVGKNGKRWVREVENVKDAIYEVKYDPVLDEEGEPIVDCVPRTSVTSAMLAQLTVDH